MKKLLSRLFWVPVGLLIVVFLVANRQPVALSFDPLSVENPAFATPPLPFWVWLMAALLVGFFIGAAGLWTSQAPARRMARLEHKELKALKREMAAQAPPQGQDPPLPTLEAY